MHDTFRHTAGWNRQGFKGSVDGRSFAFQREGWLGGDESERIRCGISQPCEEKMSTRSLRDLVVFLIDNEDRPPARLALASLRENLLAPGCVDFIAQRPEVCLGPLPFYTEDRPTARLRVAVAMRYPSLGNMLPNLWQSGYDGVADAPERTAKHLLRKFAPHATPGSIMGVLKYERTIGSRSILRALLSLPPERHPRGEPECAKFETIIEACSSLEQLLGGYGHFACVRNGWVAFYEQLSECLKVEEGNPDAFPRPPGQPDRKLGGPLMQACSDTADFVRAFSNEVMLPLMHESGVADESRLLRFTASSNTFNKYTVGAYQAAARMLLSGKSLPAIFEMSARWHERLHAMDAAIQGITPPPAGALLPRQGAWPVPFDPLDAPNGLTVTFLGDVASLVDEGGLVDRQGIPGLHHCVGGYAHSCAAGQSAIASVRAWTRDGFVRLSTAEVEVRSGSIRLVQNRGLENRAAPREAREAVDWLIREVAFGRLRPSNVYLQEDWRVGRPFTLRGLCGYDPAQPGAVEAAIGVWKPFLIRPLRDRAALAQAAAELYGIFYTDEVTFERSVKTWWAILLGCMQALGILTLGLPLIVAEFVATLMRDTREWEEPENVAMVTAVIGETALMAAMGHFGLGFVAAALVGQAMLATWFWARNGARTMRVLRGSADGLVRAIRLNMAVRRTEGVSTRPTSSRAATPA